MALRWPSATEKSNRKKFKAAKEIWSSAILSALVLFIAKEGECWLFLMHFKSSLKYDQISTRHRKICS